MKTIQATEENTKAGKLVIHKYLNGMDDLPRLAIVVEEDDGYGDVGVTFQDIPNSVYFFEIKNLMLVEE